MRRSSAALGALTALSLAGCATSQDGGALRDSSSVPLLQPFLRPSPQRDDPPKVTAAVVRRQREGMALLRTAQKAKADADGGCVLARPNQAGPPPPKQWLPPPPKVVARMLGREIEIDVELQGNPNSPLCRAFGLLLAVTGGPPGTSYANQYALAGPDVRTVPRRFRLLGRLPYNGVPPYKLSLTVVNPLGLRSPYVEQTVRCPPAGCLRGPIAEAHANTIPTPVLPLRGITAPALERSLNAAFAFDSADRRIDGARCVRTTCTVRVTDPLRAARGVARYRVQGEQVTGCWLGTRVAVELHPPADTSVPDQIGGCVDWQ